MKRILTALALLSSSLALCGQLRAQPTSVRGSVVSDSLWSYALGSYKRVVVYLPPSYDQSSARYPVAYYLHGWSGDETNWVKAGRIATSMDTLVARGMREMIVVMPDGDDAWWMTSEMLPDMAGCLRTVPNYAGDPNTYCVPWPHYDDYVNYDVVRWVDATFRTKADRAHRGIAGLSMGGYGAMLLALQYPETFSAAASHSGVVWPLEWAPEGVLKRPVGTPDSTWTRIWGNAVGQSMRAVFGKDTTAWFARDPVHLLDRARARGAALPALKADCGTGDPFLAGNRAFRDALTARGVALAYDEFPGVHDWNYWRTHARESLVWLAGRIAAP
ncbi:MAG: alpha/beta hydrolase [Gemmatimonadaceae bacterium]